MHLLHVPNPFISCYINIPFLFQYFLIFGVSYQKQPNMNSCSSYAFICAYIDVNQHS